MPKLIKDVIEFASKLRQAEEQFRSTRKMVALVEKAIQRTFPPVEECEVFLVPGRVVPFIVFADSGETIEQAMFDAMKSIGCNFADIQFLTGGEKNRAYEFVRAKPESVGWFTGRAVCH